MNFNNINWHFIQEEYNKGLSFRDLINKYNLSFYLLDKAVKSNILCIRDKSERCKIGKINHPQKHNEATREKISLKRIEKLNENAFYSKRQYYKGITLDSTYELIVAKSLDENNVKWIRPKPVKWQDGTQIRHYIPDFYLPDYNVYLDPKNDYLIKKDIKKISSAETYNNIKIIILDKNNLTWDKIEKMVRPAGFEPATYLL